MTNGRDKDDIDNLVSETYRELPSQQVPEHVNQAILRMAAETGHGKQNVLFAAWMKPVAWAATIGITLAIVLELNELPVTPGPLETVPRSSMIVEPDQAPVSNSQPAPPAEDMLEEVFQAPVYNHQLASPAEDKLEEAAQEKTQGSRVEASDKDRSFAAPAAQLAKPAARKRTADEPVAEEANAVRADSVEPETSLGLLVETKESDAMPVCDELSRQSADTWLECIENLSKSGYVIMAKREFEAFLLAYPDDAANADLNK